MLLREKIRQCLGEHEDDMDILLDYLHLDMILSICDDWITDRFDGDIIGAWDNIQALVDKKIEQIKDTELEEK